ncbi:exocyst complex component 3-like protein 4 isoform X2 [Nothoprocta perdicaria]|uniref:exocyst complex component 3-like protein 4 isoform X2 n=1 Tax=Nothoprocta perdicaria TaxID=30464 RepID=UPI000E1C0180|nr:exocyst complex component 3-like protein 4 isoform X2 [Nothoprocta perdicaria]
MELRRTSVTSEPASPTNGSGKDNMDVTSELNSPTSPGHDIGIFERGIKSMLSIRKSKQNLNKDKEPTGTLRGIRLSFKFSKSCEQGKSTICDEVEQIGEESESEPVKGKPLSVMEINELIQKRQLLEAFASIKYLEDEMIAERDADKYKDNPQEFARKSKDVDLLYNSITNSIQSIVAETLEHPTVEETLLASLVTLIAREEAAHPGTSDTAAPGPALLGAPRRWREEWTEAINHSARKRVLSVHMASKQEDTSWLDHHLGILSEHLSEDLLKVKFAVKKCYPEDYRVCEIYVKAFHNAVAFHLQDLSQKPLEVNELYALLNWVANTYLSELLLGHPALKPEVKPENLPLLLTPDDWDKLKNNYTDSLKEKMKSYFGNILQLEITDKWEKEVQPEVDENLYNSSLSFDIQTIFAEHMKASRAISRSLEMKTLELCLEELHEFIPRFGEEFLKWNTSQDSPVFAPYFAAYINSFHDLVSGLQRVFEVNTEELQNVITSLTKNFRNIFFIKLRSKTQPLFKKILTKDWILATEKPGSLASAVSQFSEHLQHMRKPIGQELLCDIHKYVVREYITQVIKPRRKMKGEMRKQGSTSDWLLPAIHHIADIVGEKKKDKIKEHIVELCQDYPDIRKEHILGVLGLRGLRRAKSRAIIPKRHCPQESPDSGDSNSLFAEIDAPTVISCF